MEQKGNVWFVNKLNVYKPNDTNICTQNIRMNSYWQGCLDWSLRPIYPIGAHCRCTLFLSFFVENCVDHPKALYQSSVSDHKTIIISMFLVGR